MAKIVSAIAVNVIFGGAFYIYHFIKGKKCGICGRPIRKEFELCRECMENAHFFLKSVSPFEYRDEMRKSIHRFKYSGRAEYAAFYARAMAVFAAEDVSVWDPNVIVPVPAHPSRKRKRGYNHLCR